MTRVVAASIRFTEHHTNRVAGDCRYRESTAADALAAFMEQLGASFLSHILSELQQAMTWQAAEVCLFATATLHLEIKALAGLSATQEKSTSSEGEQVAARSFLSAVFVWVSASPPPSEQGTSHRSILLTARPLNFVILAPRLLSAYLKWDHITTWLQN